MLVMQVKAACKQAYRYGRQISLSTNTDDIEHAYNRFIEQFSGVESSDIIMDYIKASYEKGFDGSLALDEANNFTIDTRSLFHIDA